MKSFYRILLVLLACGVGQSPARPAEQVYDIRDYGAAPGGAMLCTAAIQKAIDACAAAGGGTVRLAGGKFLSGTIHLRSHVTIEVAAGAALLGSTHLADYPHNTPALRSYTDNYVDQSLIAGENLDDIGLVGRGLIDGQGSRFRWTRRMPPYEKDRPFVIRLVNCRDVLVEGLRLQDSAMWMQHYLGCERVTVRGIHVWSYHNQCNDGIDLDGCKDCTVSGCVFESGDDAITLKSTFERPSRSIVISNCVARSHCNAIKMGTESNGGFKNITITNCVCRAGLSGIALELVDGGTLENVAVSNLAIDGATVPIFLRLGNRARPIGKATPTPGVGTFRNVVLSNIVASGVSKIGCSITGIPGHPIENVQLSNIQITFEGGGTRAEAAAKVPEHEDHYPECTMFGTLPAYGFYCRHVAGLELRGVQLRTARPDLRPAVMGDDAQHLVLDGLDVYPAASAAVRLIRSPGAVVRNSAAIRVESRAADK